MPDVHLSDLRPYRSSSPWGGANPERINKSQVCTPLKMRRVQYAKGLGVHAPAQLMYEIKPEYDRFVALAGIDETILLECMGASVAATDGGDGNRLDCGNIVNCGFVLKTRPSPKADHYRNRRSGSGRARCGSHMAL